MSMIKLMQIWFIKIKINIKIFTMTSIFKQSYRSKLRFMPLFYPEILLFWQNITFCLGLIYEDRDLTANWAWVYIAQYFSFLVRCNTFMSYLSFPWSLILYHLETYDFFCLHMFWIMIMLINDIFQHQTWPSLSYHILPCTP